MGIFSQWTETAVSTEKQIISAALKQFDLQEDVIGADYIFSGTIVGQKQYQVDWVDEKGELWGPYDCSVLEVKVGKDYYGKSPVKDDIIKVYYPYSLSTIFDSDVLLKEGTEYVFVSHTLDEEFVERRNRENPDDKFYQERYADVYISEASYSVLPIVNDKVIMYKDYFSANEGVMEKSLKKEELSADIVADPALLGNWFIGLSKQDFEVEFPKLFE